MRAHRVTAIVFSALITVLTFRANATVTLSDVPLFLSVAMPPNIVVTFDDSGSMQQAYVPEECVGNSVYDCARLDNRFEKSSRYNRMYYNPRVKYPAPVDELGVPKTTSFTHAWRLGLKSLTGPTAPGAINLATEYRPTAFFNVSDQKWAEAYMGHFPEDVRCNNPTSNAGVCEYSNGTGGWTPTSTSCVGTTEQQRHDSCTGPQDNDNISTNDIIPAGIPAYYYVFDPTNAAACQPNDAAAATNNACYDIKFVTATSGPGNLDLNGDGDVNALDRDERQNFANWFSFARTRNLALGTAASLAFSAVDPTVRVAWQALNSCKGNNTAFAIADCDGWNQDIPNQTNAMLPFTGAHRSAFYMWTSEIPTKQDTPLLAAMIRAGEYYRTGGENSPYDNNFSTPNSGEHACRRNYHILMTDGIWNVAGPPGIGNIDGQTLFLPEPATAPEPDITSYSPRPPYQDIYSNTLSDLAFKYAMTDLRPDLPNNLAPMMRDISGNATAQYWSPKNDPFTWQHMTNFTIGLGLTGFLGAAGMNWTGDQYAGSYPELVAGTKQWPEAKPDLKNNANAADLWHAAINSRGQFFSADDPASLSAAFSSVLTAIAGDTGSSAALSTNSTSIQPNNTVVYQARFNRDWSGNLLALRIDAEGTVGEAVWDAAGQIPEWNTRNIYSSDGTRGIGFSCNSMSTEQRNQLTNADASCQTRVRWLRGSAGSEQRNGGALRNRPLLPSGQTNVMGDIVNSDPAYVANFDYGYATLPASRPERATYTAYLQGRASSRPPMVYFGANDGKLYGVRASSGEEVFAYVPAGVYGKLNALTSPTYQHSYSVDGAITVRDAFRQGQGGGWKTVLLGGLNAGGKSVYALDVTDPRNVTADSVLWEYSDTGADGQMGLTFSQPQIGVLQGGRWVAIFGNGYNSTNGGAYLYVMDLFTGQRLARIRASDEAGDESNGLSTPFLYDSDGDKLIDTVYAGDLKGNLWKFDVSSSTPSQWKNSFLTRPLFKARDANGQPQPITSQPNAGGHQDGGAVVVFGTGRYLTASDVADNQVQSFYGIRDTGVDPVVVTDRSVLQQQSFDLQATGFNRDVRSVTENTVDWATKKGWYIDLLDPPTPPGTRNGERVISTSLIRHGRVIFVTMQPSVDPCVPGGSSWLIELDLMTGGSFQQSVLDLNHDGAFDENDTLQSQVISGTRHTGLGISKTPIWLDGENRAFKVMTGTSGGFATEINSVPGTVPPTGDPVTRRSWIQIR